MVLKIAIVLQFNQQIGPLLKIVQKMGLDFVNFLLIYFILVAMFSLIGNLNFVGQVAEFDTLFSSVMIMADASMGNFGFDFWDSIEDSFIRNCGKLFLMVAVILFAIVILNLMIAILSNTYNLFDKKSKGLFLSKILDTRAEMQYDSRYGAYLSQLTPINLLFFPFLPFSLFDRFPIEYINTCATVIQYVAFMLLMFVQFLVISALLLPIAYVKSMIFKV